MERRKYLRLIILTVISLHLSLGMAQVSNRIYRNGIYYDQLGNDQVSIAKLFNNKGYVIKDSIDDLGTVTSIGSRAAMFLGNLKFIDLPKSINYIGDEAFASCISLKSFIIRAVVPPVLGYRVFCNTDLSKCVLYVPSGSVQAYKDNEEWAGFERVEAISSDVKH